MLWTSGIIQGAFHANPTPEIFTIILILHHDKAILQMLWPSHTPKHSSLKELPTVHA